MRGYLKDENDIMEIIGGDKQIQAHGSKKMEGDFEDGSAQQEVAPEFNDSSAKDKCVDSLDQHESTFNIEVVDES